MPLLRLCILRWHIEYDSLNKVIRSQLSERADASRTLIRSYCLTCFNGILLTLSVLVGSNADLEKRMIAVRISNNPTMICPCSTASTVYCGSLRHLFFF